MIRKKERRSHSFWITAAAIIAATSLVPIGRANAQSSGTQNAGSTPSSEQGSKSSKQINLGNVTVEAHRTTPTSVPTHKQRFESAESQKLISKKQFAFVGAGAGSAQALQVAPGVHVNSYGTGSTTRYSVSINGIKQGWGGEPSGGGIDYGSIGVTFDGIPMNNPSTGLLQFDLINQMSLIDGINLTYGPGDALGRGYDDIGGRVAFLPVQPSYQAGGEVGVTAGSFGTFGDHVLLQTGSHDGYSMVLGGGYTKADSFRNAYAGFDNGSHAYAWYTKIRKTFSNGSISLGAYYALARAWRPTAIPVSPVAGLTVNGLDMSGNPVPGPLYSQTTTGYYSIVNPNVWRKETKNQYSLVYSKLNLALNAHTELHNMLWYNYEMRLHNHFNYFDPTASNTREWNNPYSKVFGDKAYIDWKLPYHNTLSSGFYYIHSVYETKQSFFNPDQNGSIANPNHKFRADYWYQDTVAAFLQDKFDLTPSLYILPGVRFVSFATNYVNNGSAEFPNAVANGASNQGSLPSAFSRLYGIEPSIDIHWKVLPTVALYASYAEATRVPENGGGGGPYQGIEASTIQLERGRDLQGGVKVDIEHGHLLHHFLFTANVYQENFSHQIIGHTLANGNTISAFGSSVYRGVNLVASDMVLRNLYVFANASWELAHFKSYYPDGGPNYHGLAVPYVPSTTFDLGTSYRYYLNAMTLTPKFFLQYTGSQHMFNDVTNATSSLKVPSYTTVNLGIDAKIPARAFGLKNIKVGLDISNLLGTKYNEYEWISAGGYFQGPGTGAILAYPGAGRGVFGTVSASF